MAQKINDCNEMIADVQQCLEMRFCCCCCFFVSISPSINFIALIIEYI